MDSVMNVNKMSRATSAIATNNVRGKASGLPIGASLLRSRYGDLDESSDEVLIGDPVMSSVHEYCNPLLVELPNDDSSTLCVVTSQDFSGAIIELEELDGLRFIDCAAAKSEDSRDSDDAKFLKDCKKRKGFDLAVYDFSADEFEKMCGKTDFPLNDDNTKNEEGSTEGRNAETIESSDDSVEILYSNIAQVDNTPRSFVAETNDAFKMNKVMGDCSNCGGNDVERSNVSGVTTSERGKFGAVNARHIAAKNRDDAENLEPREIVVNSKKRKGSTNVATKSSSCSSEVVKNGSNRKRENKLASAPAVSKSNRKKGKAKKEKNPIQRTREPRRFKTYKRDRVNILKRNGPEQELKECEEQKQYYLLLYQTQNRM